ncbi:TPA: septum formation inhibitor Maf, partial [Neisseria gonorrhoeae]
GNRPPKSITSEGKANAATYPKLVNQLNEQNLNNIAAQDPRLSLAIHEGKKNFPIGTATEGARQTSGGGWLSRDGTRQYRPPTEKKSQFATTGIQANFETYTIDSNEKRNKIKNGHLNIR